MRESARKEILGMMPYVPGKPIEEVKREYGLTEVIKIASNENPLGPSKAAVEAICSAAAGVNIYPDGYCYDLRVKLAEKLGFDKDMFIFGDGTDEILEMLFKAFVSKYDEIIFGDPSFVEYYRNTELMGGKAIKVPLTEDLRFDLEKIAACINVNTKMILLCNPNNPTGTIVTKEEVDKLMRIVPNNVLVVFDEAYFEYAVGDEQYPDSTEYITKGRQNLISLRTFSKAYGLAGLRVGYGIADNKIIELLEKVRLPFNVSLLAQVGATAALGDQKHIADSIALNNEAKNYIYSEVEKIGLKYIPTYANFMLIDVEKSSKEVFEELLKEGVIIRPMGGVIQNYIRVTTGTMAENRVFIEKLKKVLGK